MIQTAAPNGDTDTADPVPVSIKKIKKVKTGRLKVTWSKVSTNSGYEIRYAYVKNFKKAKKSTVSGGNKKSTIIKVLKNKKICYVKIRSYIKSEGSIFYSKWSVVRSKKLK